MKALAESVIIKIPKRVKNCHLIKRQKIYIPFHEIGLSCLTKDTSEINLFFETILSLLEKGIADIPEICEIMGIEYNLMKEVIVDLIEEGHVVTSANKLFITPKGKLVLQKREIVVIRKTGINQILINMLTGEIRNNESVSTVKVPKDGVCLNEVINIDEEYLENHYVDFNEVYMKQQVEYAIFGTSTLQRELYKILEKSYDRLQYVEEELLIYENDESGELEFRITNDAADRYINCFYAQVKDVVSTGMDNFFERNRKFIATHQSSVLVNKEEKARKNIFLDATYETDDISDELIEQYLESRELIDDNEIREVLLYASQSKCEGVIISAERFQRVVGSNISINMNKGRLIYIIFDRNEFKIREYLESRFGEQIRDKKIILIEKNGVDKNFVCLYPLVLVEYIEYFKNVFNKPLSMLDGRICFDEKIIKEKINPVIEEYEISFEAKKEKKEENKKQFKKQYNNKNKKSSKN